MKQPMIEGDAIACQRAIRLADCVGAKLNICYLIGLTHCFDEVNYTVAEANHTAAELGGAARAVRLSRQVVCVPVPGRANHRLEVMPGRPADRLPRQRIVGNQGRRVDIATRPVFNPEISAYEMPNSFD
jgi:hypothetical protein